MEIKDIHFRHHHSDKVVLKGITFQAERGKLTTILGPNGSGKTTLFRCIAGLWAPQRGDIVFESKSIVNLGHDKRAKIIAVVPQEHEPPFPYSVFDVVLMGRSAHVDIFSTPSKKDYAKAEAAIAAVGIEHLKNQPYTKISGGERQLILIARAIAQDSPVMLFDEPTAHLDFRNQVLVLRKIREIINEKQVIAIMTIHDPNLAMLYSDNIVMINGGSIVAYGKAEEVIDEKNLNRIYSMDVSVININNIKVVMPKLNG